MHSAGKELSRRALGATNYRVFPIGLGAMPLSIHGRPGKAQAVGVIHEALDAGVEFIDTANAYCLGEEDVGHNERVIADALDSVDGDHVVVATKGGLVRPSGRWDRDASPQSLRAACERSLRDLNVEVIALYQLHAPDPAVAFEDSVGELARLRDDGKILHVGLSNVSMAMLETALDIVSIVSVQNRCHVFCQNDLRSGFVDRCRELGVTYIPYSPVGGGNGHVRLRDDPALRRVAENHGASVYEIALAWLLRKGDNVIPIPGASRRESIVSSANAVNLELSDGEIAEIDALG